MSQQGTHDGAQAGRSPSSSASPSPDFVAPRARRSGSASPGPHHEARASAQEAMAEAAKVFAKALTSQLKNAGGSSSSSSSSSHQSRSGSPDPTPPVIPEEPTEEAVIELIQGYMERLQLMLMSHRDGCALLRQAAAEVRGGMAPPQTLTMLSLSKSEKGSTAYLNEMSHMAGIASWLSRAYGALQQAMVTPWVPGTTPPIAKAALFVAAGHAQALATFEELSLLNHGHRAAGMQQAIPYLGSGQAEAETGHPRYRDDIEAAIPRLPPLPPPNSTPPIRRGRGGGRGGREFNNPRGQRFSANSHQQGWFEQAPTPWIRQQPPPPPPEQIQFGQFGGSQFQQIPQGGFPPPPSGAPPLSLPRAGRTLTSYPSPPVGLPGRSSLPPPGLTATPVAAKESSQPVSSSEDTLKKLLTKCETQLKDPMWSQKLSQASAWMIRSSWVQRTVKGASWSWNKKKAPVGWKMDNPPVTDESFMDQELQELLRIGAVEKGKPVVCTSPIFSQVSAGKPRLICDLRRLNSHIVVSRTRLTSLKEISNWLVPDSWVGRIDVKRAFSQIPVKEALRKYLGFQWKGEVYRFSTLPFGLAISPFILIKVLKPILEIAHKLRIKVVLYMDDFVVQAATRKRCLEDMATLLRILQDHQVRVSPAKILWPSQEQVILGAVFSTSGTVRIKPAPQKLFQCKACWLAIKRGNLHLLPKGFGILGWVAQASPALKFRSRFLHSEINTGNAAGFWYQVNVLLSLLTPSLPFTEVGAIHQPELTLVSDASESGWGGVLQTSSGVVLGQIGGPHLSRGESSLVKEARGLLLALKGFANRIPAGQPIKLVVDNTPLMWALRNYGSLVSPAANHIMQEVFNFLDMKKARIVTEYIESEINPADPPSRWSHNMRPRMMLWPEPKQLMVMISEMRAAQSRPEILLMTPNWPAAIWYPMLAEVATNKLIEIRRPAWVLHPSQGWIRPPRWGLLIWQVPAQSLL